MAHTTRKGLQDFVQGKNGMVQLDGAPDAKPRKIPDVSDLRMAVTPAKSGRRTSQPNMQRNGERGRKESLRSHSGNRPASRNGLLSTDASNADRTSASGSTQHAKQGKSQKMTAQVKPSADVEAADSEMETDTDTDDQGNDLPRHSVNQGHPQAHNTKGHAFADRRISGDSYPATTSGRPSEVDEGEARAVQAQAQAQAQARGMLPPSSITVRGSGARSGMTAPNNVLPQPGAQTQANQPLHGGAGLMAGVTEGFSFGPPPSATQLNVSRPFPAVPQPPPALQQGHGQQHHIANHPQPVQQNHGHQQSNINQQSQQPHAITSRPLVDPSPAPRQSAVEKQTFMQPPAKSVVVQDSRRPLGDVSNEYVEPRAQHFSHSPDPEQRARKSRTTTPNGNAAQSELPQPSDHEFSEFDYRNDAGGQDYEGMDEQQQYFEDQHPEHQNPQDQRSEEQFPEDHHQERKTDYDDTELFKKTYEEIKGQSFDLDPNAEAFTLPEGLPADKLQDKLVSVMKLPQSHNQNPQAEFFRSMSARDWEESGDWFLDRFGNLIDKLKTARKEKRKIAREFENEIEQRHDAVAKKQKLTDSALSVMKTSGGKVLDNTPKKKKSMKPKK